MGSVAAYEYMQGNRRKNNMYLMYYVFMLLSCTVCLSLYSAQYTHVCSHVLSAKKLAENLHAGLSVLCSEELRRLCCVYCEQLYG